MKQLILLIAVLCLSLSVQAGEGALALTTVPAQAEIYVDGELKVNLTPVVIKLPAGKHHIKIKAAGKETQTLEFLIKDEVLIFKEIVLFHLFQLHNSLRKGCKRFVFSLFSPDGNLLASTCGNRIELWDVSKDKSKFLRAWSTTEYNKYNFVLSVSAFSPDSNILTLVDDLGDIKLLDTKTKKIRKILPSSLFWTYYFVFSPDGLTLASRNYISSVTLWDIETGVQRLNLKKNSFDSIAFSHNGQTLVSRNEKNTITFWDVKTGKELRETRIKKDMSDSGFINLMQNYSPSLWNDVAFSRENGLYAFIEGNTIVIRDANTGKKLSVLPSGKVVSLAFSPNGKILASGGKDGTIKLWK